MRKPAKDAMLRDRKVAEPRAVASGCYSHPR